MFDVGISATIGNRRKQGCIIGPVKLLHQNLIWLLLRRDLGSWGWGEVKDRPTCKTNPPFNPSSPMRSKNIPGSVTSALAHYTRSNPHRTKAKQTLIFLGPGTEMWYQAILGCCPNWPGPCALHHGSIEQELRLWVEKIFTPAN